MRWTRPEKPGRRVGTNADRRDFKRLPARHAQRAVVGDVIQNAIAHRSGPDYPGLDVFKDFARPLARTEAGYAAQLAVSTNVQFLHDGHRKGRGFVPDQQREWSAAQVDGIGAMVQDFVITLPLHGGFG